LIKPLKNNFRKNHKTDHCRPTILSFPGAKRATGLISSRALLAAVLTLSCLPGSGGRSHCFWFLVYLKACFEWQRQTSASWKSPGGTKRRDQAVGQKITGVFLYNFICFNEATVSRFPKIVNIQANRIIVLNSYCYGKCHFILSHFYKLIQYNCI